MRSFAIIAAVVPAVLAMSTSSAAEGSGSKPKMSMSMSMSMPTPAPAVTMEWGTEGLPNASAQGASGMSRESMMTMSNGEVMAKPSGRGGEKMTMSNGSVMVMETKASGAKQSSGATNVAAQPAQISGNAGSPAARIGMGGVAIALGGFLMMPL